MNLSKFMLTLPAVVSKVVPRGLRCGAASTAILFTIYMIPVNLLDNILRPLLAKGLSTPMPVILIGVLGGTLVHGVIGLFVGPIVLSIAWQLLVVWTRDEPKPIEMVG
jgi:predicted PurR-regulated permease PerM